MTVKELLISKKIYDYFLEFRKDILTNGKDDNESIKEIVNSFPKWIEYNLRNKGINDDN